MSVIHICLISDQTLANLIPILMDKPDEVILATSKFMQLNGACERLEHILESRNIHSTTIGPMDDCDLLKIKGFAREMALNLKNMPIQVVLNATGGNKLMSLGFIDAFKETLVPEQLRVIYTDTHHNRLTTIFPDSTPAENLQSVINIPNYLAAQGAFFLDAESDQPSWQAQTKTRKKLTYELGLNIEKYDQYIGALNKYASSAIDKNRLTQPIQTLSHAPSKDFTNLLKTIQQHGLIKWNESNLTITFLSLDATRYLNGFWLEEYVWLELSDLELEDMRTGVKVRWHSTHGKQAPRNEFDTLAIYNNKMCVIECKTSSFHKPGSSQNIVLKLESLGRNAGGLFGKSFLVFARPASEEVKNRCESSNIRLIDAKDLTNIQAIIRSWMTTK